MAGVRTHDATLGRPPAARPSPARLSGGAAQPTLTSGATFSKPLAARGQRQVALCEGRGVAVAIVQVGGTGSGGGGGGSLHVAALASRSDTLRTFL